MSTPTQAVNLRCHVFEKPRGFASAAEWAHSLGIRWKRFQSHPIGEQVWLLDCDPESLPDPLPTGITRLQKG